MTTNPHSESNSIMFRDAESLEVGTRIRCSGVWFGVEPRFGTVIECEDGKYYQLENPETLPKIPGEDTPYEGEDSSEDFIEDDGRYYLLQCEVIS